MSLSAMPSDLALAVTAVHLGVVLIHRFGERGRNCFYADARGRHVRFRADFAGAGDADAVAGHVGISLCRCEIRFCRCVNNEPGGREQNEKRQGHCNSICHFDLHLIDVLNPPNVPVSVR